MKQTRSERKTDLVIVGGGIAGLYAALCAAEQADVVLLAKAPLEISASQWAQGGIAAAVGEDDDPQLHAEDTFAAGRGLCRESAVHVLTGEGPARIVDLADLGVEFDDGLGLEGGHCRRRIVHAGGAATGARVASALVERVQAHPRIEVRAGERAVALLLAEGSCAGVRTETGSVAARATLLATGGAAALWRRTTNPSASVGDGIVLAYTAGADVADLEFTQFHPTVLAGHELLLSEALRGEGALLLDERGERFVEELAPRDVVARAIDRRGTARLDLRGIDRSRFASLMESLALAGHDPAAEPVPVAPAAHYTVGGVVTDLEARTTVPALYAAGECAATGVHGANRLASNSLLECLVFGRRAALAALAEPEPAAGAEPVDTELEPASDEIRAQLWCDGGLVREARGLERLRRAPHLLVRLIAESALARTESRGCHFRSDFPERNAAQGGMHFVHRRDGGPRWERWS